MIDAIVLSESLLTNMLPNALVYRGNCLDLDADLQPGIYTTNSSTKGTLPSVMKSQALYGTLIVLPKRNTTMFQWVIGENGMSATRTQYNGAWNQWLEPVYQ